MLTSYRSAIVRHIRKGTPAFARDGISFAALALILYPEKKEWINSKRRARKMLNRWAMENLSEAERAAYGQGAQRNGLLAEVGGDHSPGVELKREPQSPRGLSL